MIQRMAVTAVLCLAAFSAMGNVLYVDSAHCPSGNGQSWDTAYCTIQEAVFAAQADDHLWVRKGAYYGVTNLKSSLSIYGGFNGDENSPLDRDLTAGYSVLDGANTPSGPPMHLMVCNAVDHLWLDGFQISGGMAMENNPSGGGIMMMNSGPNIVISNCEFMSNTAQEGGGMHAAASQFTLQDCRFEENVGTNNCGGLTVIGDSIATLFRVEFLNNQGGWDAGGMYVRDAAVTAYDCTFTGNEAGEGGGVMGFNGTGSFMRCTFTQNTSRHLGGGIGWYSGPLTLDKCCFFGNQTDGGGGAFESHEFNQCDVTNCVVAGNQANYGAGMLFSDQIAHVTQCTVSGNQAVNTGGGIHVRSAQLSLTNSIFSGNAQAAIYEETDITPLFENCLFFNNPNGDYQDYFLGMVSGALMLNVTIPEARNIVEGDPLFQNPAENNYRIGCRSAARRKASISYSTLLDADGNMRPGPDGKVDIGAYEYDSLHDAPAMLLNSISLQLVSIHEPTEITLYGNFNIPYDTDSLKVCFSTNKYDIAPSTDTEAAILEVQPFTLRILPPIQTCVYEGLVYVTALHNGAQITSNVLPITFMEIRDGWYQNPVNGHFYTFTTAMRWEDAQSFAENEGGYLTTINDAKENAWILSLLQEVHATGNYWIGLNDPEEDHIFTWINGETAEYRNWNSGEPNYFSGSKYVELYGPDQQYPGTWNDGWETSNNRGIIERDEPVNEGESEGSSVCPEEGEYTIEGEDDCPTEGEGELLEGEGSEGEGEPMEGEGMPSEGSPE
ncbi:MAG TPA: lectin-like protein, partial [Candidatus Hydrogenedentes bacterium]|nr:lectin-like protein [Candidatus Hydrogenedentota bacterium]